MRRLVTRAIVFLAIGAVINVAVAWAIAGWCVVDLGNDAMHRGAWVLPSGERVPYLHWHQRGIDLVKWHLYYDRGESVPSPLAPPPPWSAVSALPAYNPPAAPFFVNVRVEESAGWPLRSMRWLYAVKDPPGSRHWEPPSGSIPLADHTGPPVWSLNRVRAIPLMPVWSGVALNAALYGAVVWCALACCSSLRCSIRRRRGLCPACAYPVGTSTVCTECGAPVRPATSTTLSNAGVGDRFV